jgi:hypothetical protein
MLVAGLCRRGDQAQQIFRYEEAADDVETGGEFLAIIGLHRLHRLREHDSDAERCQRVMHDPKYSSRRIMALRGEDAI